MNKTGQPTYECHIDTATWMTMAHELGHNFGAYHTINTGGVMSYDAIIKKEFMFSGSNPAELCNHVNRQVQHALSAA